MTFLASSGRKAATWTLLASGALPGVLSVAGCSALPDSGPSESRVLDSARKDNPLHYQIMPVTPEVIAVLSSEHPPLISSLDTAQGMGGNNDRIGAGDMLAITIFELGSGLFSASPGSLSTATGGTASAPGPSTGVTNTTLPLTAVEQDGLILIPYVGRIRAAGLTPEMLAETIRQKLKGKSQDPEVMVHIATDIGNTVIVSGEVHRPGRELLSSARERLSDLIAIAGGAIYPPEDTYVELLRGEQTGGTDLGTLQSHPAQDIRARPGDRIHVIYRPRSYTVFGASEKVQETPFKSPDLTLAEAVARAGGPADSRADPNAIFLFRFEDIPAARKMGITTPAIGDWVPVLYKLDMMNPNSYFLAQKLPMKNKDLIYIANAKTNRFYKFTQLIGSLSGYAYSAAWIAR
ncbi:polysaccharide biosynthesis/export family protein [Acidomonas methanolica]|uniref:polysaccharide biosynthesis/export family protein n=1 Tax=Acidomonas methanolica TaxID=437 RepID=UPI002119F937|nr:polysaccharide biosynthesis/export family protein [Acidomonas methanolica]MCQ9154528.1 polysaccharide export protein [Acidomonas methanolica]